MAANTAFHIYMSGGACETSSRPQKRSARELAFFFNSLVADVKKKC